MDNELLGGRLTGHVIYKWPVARVGNGKNVNETILEINGSLGEPILETEDHSNLLCVS